MPRQFQPAEIFRILADHRVDYVLFGAPLHGSNLRTGDTDICPSSSRDNLDRLASALYEMGALIRTPDAPSGLPFTCDADFLERVTILNLVTPFGDFDLSFKPSGTEGFEDLRRDLVRYEIAGVTVPVASLADVIRSKEAAGREKDRQQLPTLYLLLREVQRRQRSRIPTEPKHRSDQPKNK